jgi:PAS domain S-box-containing protein
MSTQKAEEKTTILIVEDDSTMAQVISALLEREGYSAIVAGDGQEALRMLGLGESTASESLVSPDLILLDILLPGLDGFEVCARVRGDERLDDVPVVMVTALGSLTDMVRGLECGADDYIAKPFKTPELLARVRAMLRIKRLHDERKRAEEALRESEERLRLVVQNMPVMLDALDADNNFIVWNRECERATGYSAEEIIGNPKALELLYPGADYLQRMLVEWSERGSDFRDWELDLTAKDGSVKTVAWSNISERFPIPGWSAWSIGVDITERRRAQEALQRYAEQLRTLSAQLAEAEEIERRQIARELHDQVGQSLTALGINLNMVRSQMPEGTPDAVRARLDDSLALVEQTTERIREVMAELRPPVLDDYGLVAALRWHGEQLASRTGLAVSVEGEEPDPRLPTRSESVLFRIAQEALTNVAKHAQAARATVTVEAEGETVRLVIADDGMGFDTAKPDEHRGWGLLSMNERAQAVDGRCRVESQFGQGTRVVVEVRR